MAVRSAYWQHGAETIEIRPDGEIRNDDGVLFRIDRAGRVSSAEGDPVAVLLPDGRLLSEKDVVLGRISADSSYAPDQQTPSVRILPDGQVVVLSASSEWAPAGQWTYCEGAMAWTCTLVTHIVVASDHDRRGPSAARDAIQLIELLKLGD